MKILKYILYVFVVLVVLFFALGFISPSVKYGHEITVNKSVQEAWGVSQDEAKYAQWLDGFKSMELLSGEYGAEGSTYKVVVNPGEGQDDFEMIETVLSKKDFDHVTLHFDSDMMDFDQTITFTETDGTTSIKTDSKVTGKGMIMRSAFALMNLFGNAFQVQEEKNIEALKKLIEANTTDYYPVALESGVEGTMSAAASETTDEAVEETSE